MDAETGLGYFRMRYYDPGEGRFISEDPLGFPDGVRNAYTYVANAPYQSVDPFGLSATGPYTIQTKDSLGNDVYASLIHGAAFSLLLNAFGDLEAFLAGVGTGQLVTADGSIKGFNPPLPSEIVTGCQPRIGNKIRRQHVPESVNDTRRKRHGNPDHWAAIVARVDWLKSEKRWVKGGVRLDTLRVNQRQVNADGYQVSTCLPDLQYDSLGGGAHQLEEFFRPGAQSLNFAKAIVMIRAADAAGGFASYLGWQIGNTRR